MKQDTLAKPDIIEMEQETTISTFYDGALHNLSIAGTLRGAGKVETKKMTVQSGGRLIIPEFLEVTGDLVAARGSEVMFGFKRPPLPKPVGLEKGLSDISDLVRLYSGHYDIPLDTSQSAIDDFMRTRHTVYEANNDRMLCATTRFGSTGAELLGFGFKPPRPPRPRGMDLALIAKSIFFESGSHLNFDFEKGYTPAIGDMFSLADTTIQVGENVQTNLDQGWAIVNSVATLQYIGAYER